MGLFLSMEIDGWSNEGCASVGETEAISKTHKMTYECIKWSAPYSLFAQNLTNLKKFHSAVYFELTLNFLKCIFCSPFDSLFHSIHRRFCVGFFSTTHNTLLMLIILSHCENLKFFFIAVHIGNNFFRSV